MSSGLIHLRSRRFNLQVTGCCSFESQGAVLLFVYFPLEACLLNNSIQQALLKPNLILWVLQGTGGDGKINRNKILFLLSGNFLSCQGGSQTAIQSPTPQEKKMVRIRKAKPTCPRVPGSAYGILTTETQVCLLCDRVKNIPVLLLTKKIKQRFCTVYD